MEDPFCDLKSMKLQTFYKTKNFYFVYNIKPVVKGHCLCITKKHMISINQLNPKLFKEMLVAIQKVVKVLKKVYRSTGFNIALQEGKGSGQSIPHFHLHLIPRRPKDMKGNWFFNIIKRELRGPISRKEIIENVNKIKKVLKNG